MRHNLPDCCIPCHNTVRLADFLLCLAYSICGISHGTNQSSPGCWRPAQRLPERQSSGARVSGRADQRAASAHGCNSQRIRSFPAVAGAYYCMALSLYPEAAYEEVFAVIAQGLARAQSSPVPVQVAKSSISELRGKLGHAPLRDLMHQSCVPRPQRRPTPGSLLRWTTHCRSGWQQFRGAR
ncbi:MAG: transposase domain-containing protein [Uliginosibacterium sp.]|nr:transposase domain-containing protein [Uliginosibacterium sp.]